MSRRSRVIALVILGLVLLLFAGRWTTLLLTEHWWAQTISPDAARFLDKYELLRFLLDLAGVLVASAWFIGNFYVVYRTIGSVQVPRRVANLEIHEALTSHALVIATVISGLLLGLLIGLGTSSWWQNVMLAWHGVTYGVRDPVLGHDLGVYVAQLPLWRRLHGFALLLTLLALGASLLLYVLVGAIRWSARRPAVSDHARRHIGWVLAAFVLVLAWGYWLEPYELVAGLAEPIRGEPAGIHTAVAGGLSWIAIAVGVISMMWALRPRHALMMVGWMLLALASILGHHVVPALAGTTAHTTADDEGLKRLEGTAFGLARLEEGPTMAPDSTLHPPGPLSLWTADVVSQLGEGDSASNVSVNQSTLHLRDRRLPVWITVRAQGSDSATVSAYADDRTTLTGGPVSYRQGDTLAYPGTVRFLQLPSAAVRPGAPEYAITTDSTGVPADGWMRRLLLAWSRQTGALFEPLPANAHLSWHLQPRQRLAEVAPQIYWGEARAHLIDGELVWLSDGYVTSGTFPIVDRAQWRAREIAAIEAPFLGTVAASTGDTHVYRRFTAGALGTAWQEITGAFAEPWSAVPRTVQAQLSYPDELFEVEARVLERSQWLGSRQETRGSAARGRTPAPTGWSRVDSALVQIAVFESPGREVTSVLMGRSWDGVPQIQLIRLGSKERLHAPSVLNADWARFATLEQLLDSLRSAGAQAETSPVSFWVEHEGIGAYQTVFGVGPQRHVVVSWVNLAIGDSLGAGRTPLEAWQNLRGISAPLLSDGLGGQLGEAERWMAVADSAIKRGDWTTFGRAFEALRQVLKPVTGDK